MSEKKKIRGYVLEALDKFPSPKVLCAIIVTILLAVIMYLIILFLLSR